MGRWDCSPRLRGAGLPCKKRRGEKKRLWPGYKDSFALMGRGVVIPFRRPSQQYIHSSVNLWLSTPPPLTLHFWANEQGLRLRGVGNAKQRPGVPVLALLPSSHDGAPRYWVLGTGQATSSRQKGPSLGATVHTYRISLGVGLTNVGFVAANSN